MDNGFLDGISNKGLDQLALILEELVKKKCMIFDKEEYSYICGSRVHADSSFRLSPRLMYYGTRDDFRTLLEKSIDDIYVPGKKYVDFKMNEDPEIINMVRKVFPFRISFYYDMNQLTTYVMLDIQREQ